MTDLIEKCAVCGALLDEEDLFCANCGTEAPQAAQPAHSARQADGGAPVDQGPATVDFECGGCGASMSFDANAGALRCPFCGNQQLEAQKEQRTLRAQRLIPFAVQREQAADILRQWLGRGMWRPGDLARRATVAKMTPVYVPYWVFQARTHTNWTADSSHTPFGARGDWYPVAGTHRGTYAGLLIGASGALTPQETAAICPFDLDAGEAPDAVQMQGEVVEQFRVKRKYARPLARQGLEAREAQTCQREYVPGRCRNMKVNIRIEDLSSEPVLVPVWIAAYRYQDQVYRFLVNGQTGTATGQAPLSWAKIVGVAAVIVVVLLFLLLLVFLARGA